MHCYTFLSIPLHSANKKSINTNVDSAYPTLKLLDCYVTANKYSSVFGGMEIAKQLEFIIIHPISVEKK